MAHAAAAATDPWAVTALPGRVGGRANPSPLRLHLPRGRTAAPPVSGAGLLPTLAHATTHPTLLERETSMSDLIKRLRERRANVWEQAKTLADRQPTRTATSPARSRRPGTRLNAELDRLDQRIKAVHRRRAARQGHRGRVRPSSTGKPTGRPARREPSEGEFAARAARASWPASPGTAFEVNPGPGQLPRDPVEADRRCRRATPCRPSSTTGSSRT